MTPSPVYTAEEAAAILGCSVRTIEDHARTRKLPGLQFGDGGWRFPVQAFTEAINQMARDALRQDAGKPAATVAKKECKPTRRSPPGMALVRSAAEVGLP